jgi:hypothetical protein
MVVGPAIFLMFVWALAWGEAGKCDLEMAERSLRLPFQRHRNRHGWRRFEEIRFFAIRPDPLSVGEGRAMARRLRARGPRRWVYRLRVAEWRRWGGLLAITEDEVIWLRESFEVLRFLDEHWSAGRTDGGRVSPSLTAATAI